jgi:hypothetical protein
VRQQPQLFLAFFYRNDFAQRQLKVHHRRPKVTTTSSIANKRGQSLSQSLLHSRIICTLSVAFNSSLHHYPKIPGAFTQVLAQAALLRCSPNFEAQLPNALLFHNLLLASRYTSKD